MVEERRETGLPASLGEGTHESPSWSELSGLGGDMARLEVVQPPVGREVEVVEIPCPSEVGTRVEPPAIPPSQELAMVRSSARPSNRARLEEALERVKVVHQAVMVDLPRIVEGLEEMSSRKSRFLREEQARMLWEAMVSWQVAELKHHLESTHHESQDRAAEATEAQVAELLAVERVTTAVRGLDTAKVHQAETEAAL
ncbi:uncharacterized protein [Miscanthus floridulus]|uniref:uncharacterized protein n=1 Tax=Miscanthus floridulus TaxID=154761 RepID=UPI0034579723